MGRLARPGVEPKQLRAGRTKGGPGRRDVVSLSLPLLVCAFCLDFERAYVAKVLCLFKSRFDRWFVYVIRGSRLEYISLLEIIRLSYLTV